MGNRKISNNDFDTIEARGEAGVRSIGIGTWVSTSVGGAKNHNPAGIQVVVQLECLLRFSSASK